MKTAKAWVEENTFALKFPDAATLIEAVQADALREAASVVRDANCGRLEAADVLDDIADSLLSPNVTGERCAVAHTLDPIVGTTNGGDA